MQRRTLGRRITLFLLLLLAATQAGAQEATPDAALTGIMRGLAEGRLSTCWDALPDSYRKSVDALLAETAAKFDAELWSRMFAVQKKLLAVARKQKAFILANPELAKSPISKQNIADSFDPVLEVLEAVVDSDLADAERLKSADKGKLLDKIGGKVVAALAVLSPKDEATQKSFGDELKTFRQATVTTVKTEGEKATVKIEMAGDKPHEESVVRIEGKWIPADWAEGFAPLVEQARAVVAALDAEAIAKNKAEVLARLAEVDKDLDAIGRADSMQAFNTALQPLFDKVQRLMTQQ